MSDSCGVSDTFALVEEIKYHDGITFVLQYSGLTISDLTASLDLRLHMKCADTRSEKIRTC